MWVSDFLKSRLKCWKCRFVNHHCFFFLGGNFGTNLHQPPNWSWYRHIQATSTAPKTFKRKNLVIGSPQDPFAVTPSEWCGPCLYQEIATLTVNFLVLGKWKWGGAQTTGAEPVVFENFWAFFWFFWGIQQEFHLWDLDSVTEGVRCSMNWSMKQVKFLWTLIPSKCKNKGTCL